MIILEESVEYISLKVNEEKPKDHKDFDRLCPKLYLELVGLAITVHDQTCSDIVSESSYFGFARMSQDETQDGFVQG